MVEACRWCGTAFYWFDPDPEKQIGISGTGATKRPVEIQKRCRCGNEDNVPKEFFWETHR